MVDFDPAVVSRDVAILVSQQVFSVFVAPARRAHPAPEGMPQIMKMKAPNSGSPQSSMPRLIKTPDRRPVNAPEAAVLLESLSLTLARQAEVMAESSHASRP